MCSNKLVHTGYNDLATTNPDIAAEWDYEKNNPLTPQMVTSGSNKYVWWQCSNGHKWKAQVNSRVRGAGCAKCSAYLRTSFPEQALLYYIKKKYPDALNRYRDIFLERRTVMELDIYIPSIRTGIEYDGLVWHSSNKSSTREKTKYEICKRNGIRLIRIKESITELAQDTCDILIQSDFSNNYMYFGNTIYRLGEHIEISNDIDISRDRKEILSQYLPNSKANSLFYTHPQLMKEWNSEKNTSISPLQVSSSSKEKVWWTCQRGHEWEASIAERSSGSSCPFCSNHRVMIGYNDLATTNPEISSEWNYDKNQELLPEMFVAGSRKKVWWICKNGHEWQATIVGRKEGNGCPYCSGRRTLEGFNDLATTNPMLSSEWNFKKNKYILPQMVTAGSNRKVWWRCALGHEWEAQINARNRGNGCPLCAKAKKNIK